MAGKSLYTFKDINYFNKIDTEYKAYFLGLIFADGSINEKLKTLQLTLREEDSVVLDIFMNEIYIDRDVRIILPKNDKHSIQKQATVTSSILYNDLVRLGIQPNKSVVGGKLEAEYIPSNLIHHFIRGYFDGDGCIYINQKTKCRYVTFTGSTDFINQIKLLLKENIEIGKGNISFRNESSTYNSTLSFGGNVQSIKIRDFLYKDATIYLERKKEKFYKEL